ncbi:MAG: acetyl-CoA carboxylase biotin carboxylase subunit [Chloroherpetonaceae bacterium]|nr:acetyl-CoA carboxylase biotin carboxylase subunit [Chthonomonadaceae bacterium]MDW8207056.1 acetyl-CoA carboxylase biotin carboxylase subunit [Chloroherpetonaceae bacterium]
MFKKILIANRGEIALRILRACREMKIRTVVAYSTADADSLPVRLADEAICIGPPPPKDSYLHAHNIISAAHITGAEAIHPGIGFLSERPSFAEACEMCHVKFIGPPAEAMEAMGDKATARATMQKAGVPVVPGTPALNNDQEALAFAQKYGYPLLVKAAFGGGGRGIRLVQNEDELPRALEMARAEAAAAFGRAEVYLEKLIEEPRHVEVQVLADAHGNVVHLGERECSIQSPRRQKIIEEALAVGISPDLRRRMGEAAVRAARAIGYVNAGTIEFLVDAHDNFYFMEMNKRLQVEHCVTEMITGIDLVQQQIRIAAGERLPFSQKQITFHGHAIECRINAEEPEREFMPSAGCIEHLVLPGGPGVRVDTHIHAGYMVPPYYDPLLAKVIVWEKDRPAAITRMQRCLQEMEIRGIKTNIAFCRKIVSNAYYRRGELTTDFIQRRIFASNQP